MALRDSSERNHTMDCYLVQIAKGIQLVDRGRRSVELCGKLLVAAQLHLIPG